jgi:hypothetical protein
VICGASALTVLLLWHGCRRFRESYAREYPAQA